MPLPRLSVLLAAALLAVPATVGAQNDPALSARIERIINRPEFQHAIWGIEVYDADLGKAIYALNADKLMFPGSTTKLLTAGTALATLGADHRFHTKVYRTGPVTGGVLRGDLVLVASGDPNLSQRLKPDGTLAFEDHDHSYGGDVTTRAVPGDPLVVIKALAQQVAAKGVKRITGRVLVDATLFNEGTRELGTGVVVSPISVNDNVLDVTVGPGAKAGDAPAFTVSPPTRLVRFVNKARTVAVDAPKTLDFDEKADKDSLITVTITGDVPLGTPAILYAYAVPSPTRFATAALVDALRAQGVAVTESKGGVPDFAKLAPSYTDANVVAEHVSAPATELVKVILKVSQNMHASAMPMLMGALYGKAKKQNGFDIEREWLQQAGLDTRGAQQGDGAGGDAHYTPAFMVSYLQMMSKRADFAAFHAALPILGRDGTLAPIQKDSPAAGQVHAKTGTFAVGDPLNKNTLVTAKGLAGYTTTASGRHLILAIFVNRVAVARGPDEVTKVVGQALGEVAAAAYLTP
ncbi:MAG: D-alanyl-D-alanine carboxypeptidase/D-alanyl-D-alanine-endopeptidase [Gemmatimonadetes bacterium]|nr:D-alanyl-D-alanine carboxypeptidase/D-alanyl-D-alanine-endopeptidase [Gemmatimonadota bacterium]